MSNDWRYIQGESVPQKVDIFQGAEKEIQLPIEIIDEDKFEVNWESTSLAEHFEIINGGAGILLSIPSDFSTGFYHLKYQIAETTTKEIGIEVIEKKESKQEIKKVMEKSLDLESIAEVFQQSLPNKSEIEAGEKFECSLLIDRIGELDIEWDSSDFDDALEVEKNEGIIKLLIPEEFTRDKVGFYKINYKITTTGEKGDLLLKLQKQKKEAENKEAEESSSNEQNRNEVGEENLIAENFEEQEEKNGDSSLIDINDIAKKLENALPNKDQIKAGENYSCNFLLDGIENLDIEFSVADDKILDDSLEVETSKNEFKLFLPAAATKNKSGFYNISYSIAETETVGDLILKIVEIPKPPPGIYKLRVFHSNKEVPALREELKPNCSLIIGKNSSTVKKPDIDLKAQFTDERNKRNCSRHQLKIYWSRGRIVIENIGNNSVKIEDKELMPAQKHNWSYKKKEKIVIANEITLMITGG